MNVPSLLDPAASSDFHRQATFWLEIVRQSAAPVIILRPERTSETRIVNLWYEWANAAALELLDWSEAELIGHSWRERNRFRLEGGWDAFLRLLEGQNGQSWDVELENRPGGYCRVSTHWLDAYLVLSLSFDRLIQPEAKPPVAQAHYLRTILDNIPASLFITRAIRDEQGQIRDFQIMEANRVAAQSYGFTVPEMVGRRASELFPNDFGNGVFDRYVQVVTTQEKHEFTFELDVFEGKSWIDVRLVPHGSDTVLATALNVTAVRKAEDERDHQAELLKGILNATQHSVVALEAIRNEEGRIVDFWYALQNETNARAIGRSHEEIRGKTLGQLFPGTMISGVFDRYREVVETGVSQRFVEYYVYDGLGGWFDISVVKRGDGAVVTIVDVTENHRNREQLEQANQELRRSNENLQQFAYVASHDLQEPLRKIQAFGDLLRDGYAQQIGTDGADLIRRMQSAAERMQTLIRDLLTYSRLSTQREVFQPVPLEGLVQGVLGDLEVMIREKNAQVRVDSLPLVVGDRLQLHQLFQNLLSNALKFSQPEVPPHVQVANRPISRRDIPGGVLPLHASGEKFWEITVEDNGIGFQDQYADRIFQVFQRLHGKDRFPGTGIGLAICKKVVDNHGGALTATGRPGNGATFRVYLPQ